MAGVDLGIDLGTTKIIVYRRGKGIVLEEPSVVAYNVRSEQVVAVGHEALAMLGKTPAYIQTECPIRDGVISNHLYTEYLVKEFVRKVTKSFLIKPRIAICIPSAITPVEARAVVEAAMSAGARKVYLVDEPLAAAMGAGIDVTAPSGHMMVDCGGGTTDIAVISLGGIVTADSLRVAGNTFDEAIIKYIQSRYKLAIGSKVAEKLKKEIGCVFDPKEDVMSSVKGRNLLTGYPEQITITQTELFDVLRPYADEIVASVRNVLERTPPELIGDIHDNGIVMTGGTSLLRGLDQLIQENTGVETRVAEDPILCVGIGTGKSFEQMDELKEGFQNAATYSHCGDTMRIVVIDGQGGGIGRMLVEQLRTALPDAFLIGVGTNSAATSAMLKAGANAGATGENAVIYNSNRADIIAGPAGILLANAMFGEISPGMAHAVSDSPTTKVLIPIQKCHLQMAGVTELPLAGYLEDAVARICQLYKSSD